MRIDICWCGYLGFSLLFKIGLGVRSFFFVAGVVMTYDRIEGGGVSVCLYALRFGISLGFDYEGWDGRGGCWGFIGYQDLFEFYLFVGHLMF